MDRDNTVPISDDLKRAVKLFNRWQFQEACDAFGQLAEEGEGRDRQYLEGLSNIASGFYRIWHKGGEPNAMVSHLEKGAKALKKHTKGTLALDLDDFNTALVHCVEEAKNWRRGDTEIFNRDFIPRIEFIDPTIDAG